MVSKSFNIGGKDRPVNFGRNALRELERLTGMAMLNTNTYNIADFLKIDVCVKAVYCGLKWGLYKRETGDDPVPSFNINMVGDWMEEEEEVFTEILRYMIECLVPKTAVPEGEQLGGEKKNSPGSTLTSTPQS